MTASATDVSEALAQIAAAIPDRSDLFEKWRTEIADDQIYGLPTGTSTAIKNALLHAASLGLLEAEIAEGLAADLNCKPLANRPDISKFDPRDDAFWSLPMAVAWIISRDSTRNSRSISCDRTSRSDEGRFSPSSRPYAPLAAQSVGLIVGLFKN